MYVHVKIGIKKKQAFDLLAIHACIIVLSCLAVGGKSKFYKAPETFSSRLFIKGTSSPKTLPNSEPSALDVIMVTSRMT